jgi:hypothetical protein
MRNGLVRRAWRGIGDGTRGGDARRATRVVATVCVAAAAWATLAGCVQRSGWGVAHVQRPDVSIRWPERSVEDAILTLRDQNGELPVAEVAISDRGILYEIPPVKVGEVIEFNVFEQRVLATIGEHPKKHEIPYATDRFLVYTSADRVDVKRLTGDLDDRSARTFVAALTVAGRLRFVRVLEPRDRAVAGTCIVLPGVLGPSIVEVRLAALVEDGWRVITFETPDLLRPLRVEMRGRFMSKSPKRLPSILDAEFADSAFAVELLARSLPLVEERAAGAPLVLVGVSLGALELPACAARLRDRGQAVPDALVFFGGGIGLDEVLLEGAAGREWLRLGGLQPPEDERTRIEWRKTLTEESELAPEHCLAALQGVRTLQMDGQFDRVVPATTADRLWRELGWPERWQYPVGHFGLFAFLGDDEWGRLRAWIKATQVSGASVQGGG